MVALLDVSIILFLFFTNAIPNYDCFKITILISLCKYFIFDFFLDSYGILFYIIIKLNDPKFNIYYCKL